MATYKITAPDGKIYRIEGPEGASQEDVQAEVIRQNPHLRKYQEAAKPDEFEDFPTEGGLDSPALKEAMERRIYEPGQMDDRSMLRGLTLGASHELGSAGAAGIAHLLGDAPEGETFGETYSDILEATQGQMERHREENPGRAYGSEMLGAAFTPDPTKGVGKLVGGGLRAWRAKRGLSPVQRTLGRMNQRSSTRMAHLGPQPRARGRLNAALDSQSGRMITRGALEGGIAGAFEADPGSRLQGAEAGAGAGAALTGALAGTGRVLRGVQNRRVAQDLGQGEDFVPYPVARGEDSFMSNMYSDLVSRGFGGKRLMGEQFERWMGPLARAKARAMDRAQTATAQVAELRAQDKQLIKDATAEIEGQEMAKIQEVTEDALEQVRGRAATQTTNARKNLQTKATENSLNPNMPDKVKDEILGLDIHGATKALDSWWTKNGFNSLKRKSFELTDPFRDTLADLSERYPEFAGILGKMGKNRKKVTGRRLVDFRNAFARIANERADDQWLAGKNRQIRRELDGFINDQLDEEGQALFRAELDAWSTKEARYQAVRSASGKRRGDFDADDWMNALGLKGRLREYGEAPLQRQAQFEQMAGPQRDEYVKLREATEARRKKRAEDKAKARTGQRRSAMEQRAEYMDRDKKSARLFRTKEAKERASAALDSVARVAPPDRVSGLGQILGTQIMSPLMTTRGGGRGSGFITNVIGGAITGTGVASQPGQRFVAGQTGWQNVIQALQGNNRLLPDERSMMVSMAIRLRDAGVPAAQAATQIGARLEGMTQGQERN